MTTTGTHALIKAALTAAGIHAVDHPALDLPAGPDGLIAQAVVVRPSTGQYQYTRASGTSSGRIDGVTLYCVGATGYDALAVADKVEAAIGGMRLSSKGGTLRHDFKTDPAPEPNADPRRVEVVLGYSTITKG